MRYIYLFILLFFSNNVFAVYDLSDAEWALLPDYCHHQGHVSLNHRATDTDRWRAALGADYEHLHHWCITYVWMIRAQRAGIGSAEGKRLVSQTEGDTLYFIRRMAPDSPRASEAYTRLGEVSLILGKINQAEKAINRAHELDPKHWQAYFLGQLFDKSGKNQRSTKGNNQGFGANPRKQSTQGIT